MDNYTDEQLKDYAYRTLGKQPRDIDFFACGFDALTAANFTLHFKPNFLYVGKITLRTMSNAAGQQADFAFVLGTQSWTIRNYHTTTQAQGYSDITLAFTAVTLAANTTVSPGYFSFVGKRIQLTP